MFRRILVPLDGSSQAEAAIEPARYLAEHLGAAVTILHVMEQNPPRQIHGEAHIREASEAQTYLEHVARSRFHAPLDVETHVHTDASADVARSIVEYSLQEASADLVVMCSHGATGARRLLFGSIAEKVAAESRLPLLLVKPESAQFRVGSLLVPLDPDSRHDMSLPMAQYLAKAFRARVALLSVIPTLSTLGGEQAASGSLMPTTTQAFLDIKEENAARDLQVHQASLRADGVEAEALISRGDPADQIVRRAAELNADIVLLSTHGRSGAPAFWARSVAPRVAERTPKPVLLLPVPTTA